MSIKAKAKTMRLTATQLDGLRVACATAADQATRQAATDPTMRARRTSDAAGYRRLLAQLQGAVACELTLWVPDRD